MRALYGGGGGPGAGEEGRRTAARNIVGVAFPELRVRARRRNSRFMHMRIGSPKVTHVYIIIEDVMKRLYRNLSTQTRIRSTVKNTVPGGGR